MVSLNAAQQGLANRSHLDLLRHWLFSRAGAARSWGAREDAGCRIQANAPVPAPTWAGPYRRWLAPWERYLSYRAPARLPGNWD